MKTFKDENKEVGETYLARGSRYLGSAGAAGVLTFALGVTMALMIKTNFTAAPKVEAQNFDINPVAEDIRPPERRARVDMRRNVIVPPPAPHITTASKTLPNEPIVAMGGNADLIWEPPVILMGPTNIRAIDREEKPLYRSEPIMPLRAERSGHCIMQFDVSAEGAPYNIAAQSCSQNLFARSSVKAVGKWKYNAKIVNSQRIARTGLTTRLTFNLTDERGRLLPE